MRVKPMLALASIFLVSPVTANDELTADEIKALFTNKTFDIHNVEKDKKLKGYDSEDGKHLVYIPWKDKTSKRKWWLEENKHCTSHPKRGDSCKVIVSLTEGKHTHTLSNFRDGNQL